MKRPDTDFVWYKLNWQRPFTLENVHGLLAHLSQLTPRGYLAFEARSRNGEILQYVGFSPKYSGKISELVHSHGDIEFNAVKNISRKPMFLAKHLTTSKPVLSLNADVTDSAVRSALAAMSVIRGNEEACVQVILGRGYAPSPAPYKLQDPHESWLDLALFGVRQATPDSAKSAKEKAGQFMFQTIILRNEKYKGDARLQKTYIVDFLSKEVRVNNGERKQWYIKDSHDAIVTPETFELVQKEMARRCNRGGGRYDSPFTGNIFCGECGGFYCHCVWHSTSSYRKYVWSCDNKHRSKTNCKTPKVEDYEIEAAFIKVVQRLVSNHESYTEEYERIFLSMIGDTSTLENRLQKASEEYSILMEKVELLIEDNARRSQDQNIYATRFEALNAQLQEKRTELEALKNEITETLIRKENVKIYLAELRKVYPKMNKFDVAAWYRLVEYATVTTEKTIIFHMRDGHDEVIALEEVH